MASAGTLHKLEAWVIRADEKSLCAQEDGLV